MVETEITNILENYIDNDEDYFKVVDFIENQDKMLYAKNHTNKMLITEKKELQTRIDKAIEELKELRYWIVSNKHNENTDEHYLVVDYGTLIYKLNNLDILRGEEDE